MPMPTTAPDSSPTTRLIKPIIEGQHIRRHQLTDNLDAWSKKLIAHAFEANDINAGLPFLNREPFEKLAREHALLRD